MSGRKDEKFEEEEEDKKCPPNLHVSRSNPIEGNKKGRAALVYEEEGEDTKKSSRESSDHEKAHREFAQKDVETIEMEEGFFCAEWEKFNDATDGHVPISNPKERGVRNEARTTTHGSSGGRHAASSPRGTHASPGAEAVDSRAHPPNNAQRRTCTLPPTRPGAQRMPGPDCEGFDEDEDQMTFVSREETDIPIVPEAERVNPEKDRQAAIDDFIATAPVADVIPDVVPEVTPEVSPDNKGWRRKLVGAFLLVSMIAIVVGAVLGSRPDDEDTMSSSGYEALLTNVSSDEGQALRNSSTPQYKAFNWMVINNEASSDEQIIQRYALATIFYSTNGDSWDDKAGWLSEADECSWYRVNCTSSGAVTGLVLRWNNVKGTLPPEIGLLSELEKIELRDNGLTGSIPSEVGKLTKLTRLTIANSTLAGTIPSEIGQLKNLTSIDLYYDNLSGPIPTQVGQLTTLTYLYLGNNKLSGPIPSEIGQLTKLNKLYLWYNNLSGTIPTEMNSLVNLYYLILYGNNLMGTYTCPEYIDVCYISCDDSSNDTCRSL